MGGYKGFALVWLMVLLLAIAWMLLAVGLVQPAHADPLESATVVIHVEGVSPKGGTLRLGLYDEAGYPSDSSKPVASADVPAVVGDTIITLHNVPAGTYAVETYQDVNSNGRMDSSWLGVPQEPYGFSRDARPILSKPGFERVKFTVVAGMNVETLHLQNAEPLLAAK